MLVGFLMVDLYCSCHFDYVTTNSQWVLWLCRSLCSLVTVISDCTAWSLHESLLYKYSYWTELNNHFMALWVLFGTTRVSWYRKNHSPTHTYHGHQSSLICFLHVLQSTTSSLFSLCPLHNIVEQQFHKHLYTSIFHIWTPWQFAFNDRYRYLFARLTRIHQFAQFTARWACQRLCTISSYARRQLFRWLYRYTMLHLSHFYHWTR